ncbi:hypothetical protein EDB80DRAFT_776068 [Ilyonectria destructans]|nr:hypothetical protein EDB80DRAFT_776068 [Ilyonectria destructans]
MFLKKEESDFLNRYLEQLPRSYDFPHPFATVLVCSTRNDRTGPVQVLRRLWSAEYDYDADPTGEPEIQIVTVSNRICSIGLDWLPLREESEENDYHQIIALNAADAVVLAYDDTDRESFKAVVDFYDKLKGLPVSPSKPSKEPMSPEMERSKAKVHLESLWFRLKSYLKRTWKHRKQEARATKEPESKMDPGPTPVLVIGNRCPHRPCVVPREEGEELARQIGADFYMISTWMLNWGDCDVLEQLAPRLLFQRACGREKGVSMAESLRYGFM